MGMVTLHDGRQVDSSSEEWRRECEARFVMNLPTKQARRRFLYGELDDFGKPKNGILKHRGMDEVKRIEAHVWALWRAKKAADEGGEGGNREDDSEQTNRAA